MAAPNRTNNGPHFHFMLPDNQQTKRCVASCKCTSKAFPSQVPVKYRGSNNVLLAKRTPYDAKATLHVYLCETHREKAEKSRIESEGWDYRSALGNFVAMLEEKSP